MSRKNKLTFWARVSLFIVSYSPLFLIMTFCQLYKHHEYLHCKEINKESIICFIKYFGFISFIMVITILGTIGLIIFLINISRRCAINGDVVTVVDIENKNNESLTYLFTYILPFVFQDLSKLEDIVPICILLLVTLCIYMNSTLILINPTISPWFSLYMVEFKNEQTSKKGMFLSPEKFLEEGDQVKIKQIGHKLFYAKKQENSNV